MGEIKKNLVKFSNEPLDIIKNKNKREDGLLD